MVLQRGVWDVRAFAPGVGLRRWEVDARTDMYCTYTQAHHSARPILCPLCMIWTSRLGIQRGQSAIFGFGRHRLLIPSPRNTA